MSDFDGGAAFPVTPPVDAGYGSAAGYPLPEAGMSLRDYFAAQALAGYIARGGLPVEAETFIAARCYRLADAMVAERAKP